MAVHIGVEALVETEYAVEVRIGSVTMGVVCMRSQKLRERRELLGEPVESLLDDSMRTRISGSDDACDGGSGPGGL